MVWQVQLTSRTKEATISLANRGRHDLVLMLLQELFVPSTRKARLYTWIEAGVSYLAPSLLRLRRRLLLGWGSWTSTELLVVPQSLTLNSMLELDSIDLYTGAMWRLENWWLIGHNRKQISITTVRHLNNEHDVPYTILLSLPSGSHSFDFWSARWLKWDSSLLLRRWS